MRDGIAHRSETFQKKGEDEDGRETNGGYMSNGRAQCVCLLLQPGVGAPARRPGTYIVCRAKGAGASTRADGERSREVERLSLCVCDRSGSIRCIGRMSRDGRMWQVTDQVWLFNAKRENIWGR